MNSLIIGGSSKIGRYLIKNNKKYYFTYFKNKITGGIKFNICQDNIETIIKKKKISKVIFLSAISDPNICFKEKKKTYYFNVSKTKKIIKKLIKKKIYIIFFSSEYVYRGLKGNYSETDKTLPVNEYGRQKLEIEKYLINNSNNYAIFRLAKSYSDNLKDDTLISSFLNQIAKGKKIFAFAGDQKFNPIYLGELEKIIKIFLRNNIQGIYNIGGKLKLSRFQFYNKINKYLPNKLIKIKKTKLKYFHFFDKRPLNNTLNIKKLSQVIKLNKKNIDIVSKRLIKELKFNEKVSKRRQKR